MNVEPDTMAGSVKVALHAPIHQPSLVSRFLKPGANALMNSFSIGPVFHFRDGFFPYEEAKIKEFFEEIKRDVNPDLIFTHYRDDRHQDHRAISDLTWNPALTNPFSSKGQKGVLLGVDTITDELVVIDTRNRFPFTNLFAITVGGGTRPATAGSVARPGVAVPRPVSAAARAR